MKEQTVRLLFLLSISAILSSCANIVPPEGGKKDETPPKLISISPKDSLLNTRVTEIEMKFDEFLVLKDASQEVQVSPLLPFPLEVKLQGKKVKVQIPDSLLKENTTYRINFGNAIRDLHEENPFQGYNYIFSTGAFFDSLKLQGKVLNANTGKPANDVYVIVHLAEDGDSAVVKKKPLYVVKSSSDGRFTLPGLPAKEMNIYALRDENDNMIFDGDKEEIAFFNMPVQPQDSVAKPILLNLFKEKVIDTLLIVEDKTTIGAATGKRGRPKKDRVKMGITYLLSLDTSDVEKRTFDVNEPVTITLSLVVDSVLKNKVFLSYDSLGIDVEAFTSLSIDSVDSTKLLVYTNWKENTVYTLRLLKGFVKDTLGIDAMPSKYTFRTKGEDDYSKLQVNVPSRYKGAKYILQVSRDKDTIYKAPITDTVVKLRRLTPGTYNVHLIIDKNENGKWDTGNLLEKIQPEIVIPYANDIILKKGWENVEEFTPVLPTADLLSPPMRDTNTDK